MHCLPCHRRAKLPLPFTDLALSSCSMLDKLPLLRERIFLQIAISSCSNCIYKKVTGHSVVARVVLEASPASDLLKICAFSSPPRKDRGLRQGRQCCSCARLLCHFSAWLRNSKVYAICLNRICRYFACSVVALGKSRLCFVLPDESAESSGEGSVTPGFRGCVVVVVVESLCRLSSIYQQTYDNVKL